MCVRVLRLCLHLWSAVPGWAAASMHPAPYLTP